MHVRDHVLALLGDAHRLLAAVGHGAGRALRPQQQPLRNRRCRTGLLREQQAGQQRKQCAHDYHHTAYSVTRIATTMSAATLKPALVE